MTDLGLRVGYRPHCPTQNRQCKTKQTKCACMQTKDFQWQKGSKQGPSPFLSSSCDAKGEFGDFEIGRASSAKARRLSIRLVNFEMVLLT